MTRSTIIFGLSIQRLLSLSILIAFCFSAATLIYAQDDEEEFVQEGIVSSTDEPGPDPFKLFLEAQDAHEQGDLDKALELYSAALSELPEFPEAEYQMAVIYQGRGLLDKAESSFRRALEFKPDWTLAMAGLGSVLVGEGKYDEADLVLTRALQLDSMSFPAYVALTTAYLGRPTPGPKIRALYSKLVYVTSKSNIPADVWTSKASLERTMGDLVEAKKSLRISLEIEPNNKYANFEKAELAIAAKDYEGAISLADSLLTRFPNDTGATILLARGYALKGETDKALAILDALSTANQQAADIASAIRASVVKTDIPALEAGLDQTPNDPNILGSLCVAYRRSDSTKAADYCRRASELEPGNISHAIGYGAALVQMRQYRSAVSVLEQLKKLESDNHTVRANLATAYFQLGKFENAKAEYRWILEKQPQLAAGYYFLGITHDRLSEFVDAMANYQMFLRIANRVEFEDEIGRVRLRLPSLQNQIDKRKKE